MTNFHRKVNKFWQRFAKCDSSHKFVHFFTKHRKAIEVISQNLQKMGVTKRAKSLNRSTIIKQLLNEVFVISRIIKVSVRVINRKRNAEADNPYRDLDYSGYLKNRI